MSLEIELKMIAQPQSIDRLRKLLGAGQIQQLHNTYYDTPKNDLRQQDCGLRIRTQDQQHQLTLKTAGKVIGGLHQRPEFNLVLDSPLLDLQGLPADVWPTGWQLQHLQLQQLQQQLQPVFTTNFTRERWLIDHQGTQIEIVLDQGEIAAGTKAEQKSAICEIELELVQGDIASLLDYARQLAEQGGLRLGGLSKAARGYLLAQPVVAQKSAGQEPQENRSCDVLPIPAKATLEQAFIFGLETALNEWQQQAESWLAGEPRAQGEIARTLALIRQTFTLFNGVINRKQTALLRQQLTEVEAALTDPQQQAADFCYAPAGLLCQLSLLAWLNSRPWQSTLDERDRQRLAGSFKRFADIMLSRSGSELKEIFRQGGLAHGQTKLTRLQRELLNFRLLSGVYPARQYHPYLEAWSELEEIIRHARSDVLERYRVQAMAQAPFWLHGGN